MQIFCQEHLFTGRGHQSFGVSRSPSYPARGLAAHSRHCLCCVNCLFSIFQLRLCCCYMPNFNNSITMCYSSHDHSGHVKSLVDGWSTVFMLALKPWLTSYGSDCVLTECSRVVLTAIAVVQMGMTVWHQILMATSLKIMQRLHPLQPRNQKMEHRKKRLVRRTVTNRRNRNSQTEQSVPCCSVLNMHHQRSG